MPTRLTPARAMTLMAEGDPVECRIVIPGQPEVTRHKYTRLAIEARFTLGGIIEHAHKTAAEGFGLLVRNHLSPVILFVRTKPDIDWPRELAAIELEQEEAT